MIEVTFCADTNAELRTQMCEFLGCAAPTEVGKPEPEKPKATKTESPKVEAPKSEAPKAEAPKTEAPAGQPTYKEIQEIVPKLVSKHGKPKVVALLATFGASKGPELKPEQYADFLAKAKVELPL